MNIFDGKKHAQRVYDLISQTLLGSKLVILQVGDDLPSSKYIELKQSAAKTLQVAFELYRYPTNISESILLAKINELNEDPSVTGFMVQSPLPKELNLKNLVSYIRPEKDVDGMNVSLSSVAYPAVVESILEAIEEAYEVSNSKQNFLKGKVVSVVNDSIILGRPLAMKLLDLGATVKVLNKFTVNLEDQIRESEIIISGTGVKSLIKIASLSLDQVCIDCGAPQGDFEFNNKFDFDALTNQNFCKFIAPVPKGIGPLTVAKLFENLAKLYSK